MLLRANRSETIDHPNRTIDRTISVAEVIVAVLGQRSGVEPSVGGPLSGCRISATPNGPTSS